MYYDGPITDVPSIHDKSKHMDLNFNVLTSMDDL